MIYKHVTDLVQVLGIVYRRERWFVCGVVVRERLTQVE